MIDYTKFETFIDDLIKNLNYDIPNTVLKADNNDNIGIMHYRDMKEHVIVLMYYTFTTESRGELKKVMPDYGDYMSHFKKCEDFLLNQLKKSLKEKGLTFFCSTGQSRSNCGYRYIKLRYVENDFFKSI